ncbi:MAG: response regulator [Desulfobacterales bacterium]|nr:response regulator [Desulfobacterales bacterium]
MSRSASDEIVEGYMEEVKTYIPSLVQGLESLSKKPDQKNVIEEVHRLVHTIKGASSMVGIFGLSHIAVQMEDTLDEVMAGKLALSNEAIKIMSNTVGHFQEYCSNFLGKGVDAHSMLKETFQAFRQLRGLTPDEDALQELLEIVPELEGGNGTGESDEPVQEDFPDDGFEFPTDLGDDEDALMELLESEPDLETGIDDPFFSAEDDIEVAEEEEEEAHDSESDSGSEPLPELLESFYEEAEEHLQDLDQSLNTLESQIIEPAPITPPQKEVIRQIRRSVHTLKGASAVIGLSNVSAFAHSFEDLLDWMYETAKMINPETISVLIDSANLLERIVSNPKDPQKEKADALRVIYNDITGTEEPEAKSFEPGKAPVPQPVTEVSEPEPESVYEVPEPAAEADVAASALQQTKTLRVGMERIDELVNLAGELIIASSAFDQKMDFFINAVNELEISRNRLREIAREMEIGYEVKALEGMNRASDGRRHLSVVSSNGQLAEKYEDQGEDFEEFDTLELDRYSQLSLIIRTLNESVIDVGAINTHLVNIYSDFDGHLTRQRVLLSELQDKMMRVRMIPMGTITNKLRRTVREIAAKLGKKIRLIIEGADIELDRIIWEKITDPLMHILRNAADHGIEPPELRQALEKTPVGTIKLVASREGNQVVIRITDDGSGLNYQAIREIARKAKLSDKIDQMSDEEVGAFIFHPGFSTKGKISEVSGRGVGMDVVKENIEELKGVVRIASWKGEGTRFTIRIPLTLAAIRALLFDVGGQIYAISLSEIKEILRINPDEITGQLEEVVKIGDELMPIYYLENYLGIRQTEDAKPPASDELIVLVVESGENRGAVVVDMLAGQQEIVIKGTGSHLRYVKGVSGVTIMGDGSVVPILNIEELCWSGAVMHEAVVSDHVAMAEKPLEIMVVDDSVSIRQVVSRLMEDQGWKVAPAKDGIDALEQLRNRKPDCVILDVEMPRMNGYEFLSAIKVQPAYQNIPVIMLTSRTLAKHRDKAIALGAKGFISKPYNDDEFVNLVLKLTDKDR